MYEHDRLLSYDLYGYTRWCESHHQHGHCELCSREQRAKDHHARVIAREKANRDIRNLPNVPIKRMDRSNVAPTVR